ncbi:MAG: hypothetical protein AMXMBFR16_10210 [Candidatus Uhrbacteria bacterium]
MILRLPSFGTEVSRVEVHTLSGVQKTTADAATFREIEIPEDAFLVTAYGVQGREVLAHQAYTPELGWTNYHQLVHDAEKLKAKYMAKLKPVKPRPEKQRQTGWVKPDAEQQPDERPTE